MTENPSEVINPKIYSEKEMQSIMEKAWEDGYTTSSADSFHGKNTSYKNSDCFKELGKTVIGQAKSILPNKNT
jgi:hypothetical protein